LQNKNKRPVATTQKLKNFHFHQQEIEINIMQSTKKETKTTPSTPKLKFCEKLNQNMMLKFLGSFSTPTTEGE